MAAEGHALTAGDYIVHHLTHLSTGKPKGLVDFSVVNWDSVFFSIAIGALGCWLLWLAARKATGSFADLEAVKKVPDIDVKRLEEHKEAVAF